MTSGSTNELPALNIPPDNSGMHVHYYAKPPQLKVEDLLMANSYQIRTLEERVEKLEAPMRKAEKERQERDQWKWGSDD